MSDSVLKLVDFSHSQETLKIENLKDQRIDSMNQNMNKRMEKLQNSILHNLDEIFPEGDIKTQGNHENVEKKIVSCKRMIIHHSKIHIIRGSTRYQGTN